VVDWAAARAAFVACDLTIGEFARSKGLSRNTVKSRCTREHWLDERRRLRAEAPTDWQAVEAEFIARGQTLGQLAAARGLSPGALRGRAHRGEWVRKRALYRAGNTGANWAQLRAEFALCHQDLCAFSREHGLKYSTAYRHYRDERWELARASHRLDVARKTGLKVGRLQARAEDDLDFVADDHCAGSIDAIDRLRPNISRMQDVKVGMQAFILAHRLLRVTHGLTPEKQRPVCEVVTLFPQGVHEGAKAAKKSSAA
jgi:hypothetical protein